MAAVNAAAGDVGCRHLLRPVFRPCGTDAEWMAGPGGASVFVSRGPALLVPTVASAQCVGSIVTAGTGQVPWNVPFRPEQPA